jgi:hypothetical protein
VNEADLSAREAISKHSGLIIDMQHERTPMTAFIATVSFFIAGTLVALVLSTDLEVELALAVVAII